MSKEGVELAVGDTTTLLSVSKRCRQEIGLRESAACGRYLRPLVGRLLSRERTVIGRKRRTGHLDTKTRGGNRQTGLTDRKAVLGVGERRGSRQWTAGRAGVSLDLVAVPVPGALEACP